MSGVIELVHVARARRLAELDPASREALEALASCWRRRLPRIFRYGALRRHGALRFLAGHREAYPTPREPYPAFDEALRRELSGTLTGGFTLGDLRRESLAERLVRDAFAEQPFPLVRRTERQVALDEKREREWWSTDTRGGGGHPPTGAN